MDFNIDVKGDFQEILAIGRLSRELVEWTRVLPNDVVNEINEILREEIIDNSLMGTDVDGAQFQELKGTYPVRKAGRGFPPDADLHFDKFAFEKFRIDRDASGASARNRSIAHFEEPKQALYMKAHQTGAPSRRTKEGKRNPLAKRKFFPEDDDMMNQNFSSFRNKVETILIDYLNRLNERKARRGS